MSHWRDLLIELGCRSFLFGTNESVSEQSFTLPLNFLWLSIVFLKFDSLAPFLCMVPQPRDSQPHEWFSV